MHLMLGLIGLGYMCLVGLHNVKFIILKGLVLNEFLTVCGFQKKPVKLASLTGFLRFYFICGF